MAYLTAEKKQELFGQYGKSNTDTGSPESQIALFSYRISHLTEHLKSNKHDFGTQRALLRLVGKRRALLEYLKEVDIERYRAELREDVELFTYIQFLFFEVGATPEHKSDACFLFAVTNYRVTFNKPYRVRMPYFAFSIYQHQVNDFGKQKTNSLVVGSLFFIIFNNVRSHMGR